jgi:hypothetical protein
MRSVGRRPVGFRRGRERWIEARKSQYGRAPEACFRRPPQATAGPICVDDQGILAYAAAAVAILLAAMNANVSAGPRVPPEPG